MDIHEAIQVLAREGMSVRTIAERIECSSSHVRNLLAGKGEYIPVRSVTLIQQALAELASEKAAPALEAIEQAAGGETTFEAAAIDPTLVAPIDPQRWRPPLNDEQRPMQSARPIGWWARLMRRLSGAQLQRELER